MPGDDPVDGVLGHPPVGGELAADHGDEACRRPTPTMLWLRDRSAVDPRPVSSSGPEAGVASEHVGVAKRTLQRGWTGS